MKILLAIYFALFMGNIMASSVVENQINIKSMKIMPLGDSVTFGINYPGGYRIKLEKTLLENGIKANFVGSMSNGSDSLISKNNEGHSGWTIQDLAEITPASLEKYQPELILLMIGSNDLWIDEPSQKPDVEKALNQLQQLITVISEKMPSSRIIVASIPPEPFFWNNYVVEYNSGVKNIVATLKNNNIQFADVYNSMSLDDLDPNDGYSGDHPSQIGYEKIADVWLEIILKKPLQ